MAKSDRRYQPEKHVTAGWLRRYVAIDRSLPDDAWIPASAVKFGPLVIDNPNENPDRFSAHICVEFTAPFRVRRKKR